MAHFRARHPAPAILVLFATFAVCALLGAAPAAAGHSDPAIITALDEQGRYLEPPDAGIDAAIGAANADGIAFAWLDQGGDSAVAVSLADDYVEDLDQIGSRYHTVVVLTGEGFASSSTVFSQTEIDRALDASFNSFRTGDAGPGLDTFTQVLTGAAAAGTTETTTAGQSGSSDSGGGIGFGTVILGIAAVGGAFLLIKSFSSRRKVKRHAEIDMEEDRAEIKEQLKNNADRVISLGDRVIAKGDQELIGRYEDASMAYQDVSQSIDGASTAAEVDALDDRIDHAEWQLETIEAELDGLPAPPSLEARRADEATAPSVSTRLGDPGTQPPPPGAPTEPPVATSPRTGRRYPRTTGSSARRGGFGGGLGGVLGSILSSVVLGGLGGGNRSRRSQRRGGGLGDVFGGGSGGLGRRTGSAGRSPGGGVLRRGGASRTGRGSKPRTSSSGRNRSSGRSRSRGGRSF